MNIAPAPPRYLVAFARSVLYDLDEYAADINQHAAEIAGQHAAEASAYGDSWPGAAADIDRARRGAAAAGDAVYAYLRRLDALGLAVWVSPPPAVVALTVDGEPVDDGDDIPF